MFSNLTTQTPGAIKQFNHLALMLNELSHLHIRTKYSITYSIVLYIIDPQTV